MKAGQPSNPTPKNTRGRNAWYMSKAYTRMLTAPLFSTANNWGTECLSTVMSVSRSIFTQWKSMHRGEEWTTATHNMGGWALDHQYERGRTVWLHVCEVQNRKRSHSDRGTVGGIFSERGQEGSGREDGRFSILIWLMATQAHTYGKTHPAVRRRFVHCPTKKVWVAQSCLTLCNLTDYSLPGSSVHGTLQARTLVGLPCPPPGDLPDPGMELRSPTSAGRFFTVWATREVQYLNFYIS